ncbi:MAG: tryptophan-rich sensory protein [Enhydrobacter sp.]|nr:MAG: tryptophan-rich sensory protein [Enhydrobacter sp.]
MLLVVGGGLAIGALTRPDDWYRALAKPPFNPPDWVFAPVWTALYAAIAVAGWRTWRRGRDRAGMALWWGQLALNFAWTPLFFGAHRIDLALATIVVLLATILGFIAWTAARDRISALLFVPYAVWVGFATILTTALFARNS